MSASKFLNLIIRLMVIPNNDDFCSSCYRYVPISKQIATSWRRWHTRCIFLPWHLIGQAILGQHISLKLRTVSEATLDHLVKFSIYKRIDKPFHFSPFTLLPHHRTTVLILWVSPTRYYPFILRRVVNKIHWRKLWTCIEVIRNNAIQPLHCTSRSGANWLIN